MDKGVGVTIVGLEIENVKAIRAIAIHPKAIGAIKLCGANAAGKSSIIDAIHSGLGGKRAQPELPIRMGESSARVDLDLGAFTVSRTWTESGSYLVVKRGDGKVAKPQEFLDGLVGAGLGFDPAAFGDKDDASQVKDLLGCVQLPQDPRVIDEQIKLKFDDRTRVNRKVKELRAQAGGIAVPEGTPDQELSLSDLMQEHERIIKQESDNVRLRVRAEELNRQVEGAEAFIVELEEKLDSARKRRVVLHEELSDAREKVEALVEPDPDALKHQIQTIQETNQAVRLLQKRQTIEEDALGSEVDSNLLTAEIEDLRKKKSDMLASAPFPVEGLSLAEHNGGYRLTYRDVPLSQCSSSERIRVGMAVAMATNPNIRIILMRQGSLLDDAAVAEVERLCKEHGFQVFLEIVSTDGDEDGFLIKDGGIIGVPKEE